MKRTLPLCGFVLVAIAVAAGCGGAPEEPGGGSNVVVSKDAVIATMPIVNSATVTDTSVAFPTAGNAEIINRLTVGVVVVGSPSDTCKGNSEGFIRRVKNFKVDGASITVETELAELGDVIESGTVGFDPTPVDFGGGADEVGGKGLKVLAYAPPSDLGDYKFKYIAKERVLASFQETKALPTGSADIAGKITFKGAHFAMDPKIGYKFNKNGLDSSISVNVGGRVSSGAGINAVVTASVQIKPEAKYEKNFGTVDKDLYTSPPAKLPKIDLGVFKIQPTAQIKVSFKCDQLLAYGEASVDAGVNASANASFSATLSRRGIDTKFDKGYTFAPFFDAGAKAEFSGKCSLVGTVSVSASGSAAFGLVKGNASASIDIAAGIEGNASANISTKDPNATACGAFNGFLKADANVSGGAKVPLISGFNFSKSIPLCDIKFDKSGGKCAGDKPAEVSQNCGTREDGIYCSAVADYAALECKDKKLRIVRYCLDTKQACKGGPGGAATAEGDSSIACE